MILNTRVMSRDEILSQFRIRIKEASNDEHCIESAYEDVMNEFAIKCPQMKQEFLDEFNRMDQEERDELDLLGIH